ncbi:MAG: hypothetical protein U5M51_12365 [Emticicia sp.]|nr:hypothetical protein [Emticicia sp.]
MNKIFFFLILSFASFAQIKPNTLYWKPGHKLSFSDFHGKDDVDFQDDLRVYQNLEYDCKQLGRKNFYIETNSIFNSDMSWIKASQKTAENLQYAQILFDIYGLHSLILKNKLKKLTEQNASLDDYKNLQFQVQKQAIEYTEKFELDFLKDKTIENLNKWQDKVNAEIENTPKFTSFIEESKNSFGLFFGLGYINLNGKTSDLFKNPVGLNSGFDFDFSKNRLFLNGTLGGTVTKTEFERKGLWSNGLKSSATIIELGYGRIFKYKNMKFIPCVALNVLEFLPANERYDRDDTRNLTGHSPNVGIMTEYYFKRKVINQNEISELYLKTKLSFGATNFKSGFSGNYINFQANIGFMGRGLKAKYL